MSNELGSLEMVLRDHFRILERLTMVLEQLIPAARILSDHVTEKAQHDRDEKNMAELARAVQALQKTRYVKNL